jgi:hypothetical protein
MVAAVGFWQLQPTFDVVTNTDGFCTSWNVNSISVNSLMPISGHMWNISTQFAKYLVSHHFQWRIWPGRVINSTLFCWRGAPQSALSFTCGSERISSLNWSTNPDSGYCTGWLNSSGTNVSLGNWKMGQSTQVSNGYFLYDCPVMPLTYSVSPCTNPKCTRDHLGTLHALEVLGEVYLATGVSQFVCSSSVCLRVIWFAFC